MLDLYNQFKEFKSFEVVFHDKNNKPQKLICSVKSIENNSVIITASNEKNKNVFASVGDELKLYIYTENGIYSAASKIILATKNLLSTEYVISYPTNSKHSQRREYFRADLPINFNMEIISDKKEEKRVISSITRNICGKGMSFISKDPFLDYSVINLELNFEDKKVSTIAELVYSKAIRGVNATKYIHAFTFVSISQKNIDFIVKKCFLYQLDLRKHNS